jgi:hypothetical protein
VKSEQLLTQGKIFEDDILAGPECTNNPAEEVPEPYDHAQNLTGTLPIELGAKSLILRVYDVLMNDNSNRDTAGFNAARQHRHDHEVRQFHGRGDAGCQQRSSQDGYSVIRLI